MAPTVGFAEWYKARLGGQHVLVQGLLWFLYGFIWIPVWYLSTRKGAPRETAGADAARAPKRPSALTYVAGAAVGGLLGWFAGEAQATPFVPRMGDGFLMAFRLTGVICGVTLLPISQLLTYRLGIQSQHFKRIGYWKLGIVALIGMGLGSAAGFAIGVWIGAGFAAMTPSMVLAFVGLIVPVMLWGKLKAGSTGAG